MKTTTDLSMHLCITAQEYNIYTSFRFLLGDSEAHKGSVDAFDFLLVGRVLSPFPVQQKVFDLLDSNKGQFNLLMKGDVFDLLVLATEAFSFPTQEMNAFVFLKVDMLLPFSFPTPCRISQPRTGVFLDLLRVLRSFSVVGLLPGELYAVIKNTAAGGGGSL